jgi:tol-pal system protein YbgF
MKTLSSLFCGTMLCVLLAGCASQRDVLILDERLRSLDQRNAELVQQQSELRNQINSEVTRAGQTTQAVETDLRSQYAGLKASIDRMQQELRLLTGRLEVVEHNLQRRVTDDSVDGAKKKELEAVGARASQIDQRLTAIEQFLDMKRPQGVQTTPPAAAPTPKPDAAAPKVDDSKLTDREIYATAKQAFDNGQMEAARRDFEKLLTRYPQSELANNAQFWIGESHYRERWYEKAILEYQTVIEKYPGGSKVAAAMLKQGFAFLQLGDEANARLVLGELQKRHPESSEAKVAAKKLDEL